MKFGKIVRKDSGGGGLPRVTGGGVPIIEVTSRMMQEFGTATTPPRPFAKIQGDPKHFNNKGQAPYAEYFRRLANYIDTGDVVCTRIDSAYEHDNHGRQTFQVDTVRYTRVARR